jgi:hypothetical protein
MIAHVLINLTAAALGSVGLLNLVWMWMRRGSPVEARGFLLAGSACMSLAVALLGYGLRAYYPSGAALLLSVVSGVVWIHHIFRQSLHNTTM